MDAELVRLTPPQKLPSPCCLWGVGSEGNTSVQGSSSLSRTWGRTLGFMHISRSRWGRLTLVRSEGQNGLIPSKLPHWISPAHLAGLPGPHFIISKRGLMIISPLQGDYGESH